MLRREGACRTRAADLNRRLSLGESGLGMVGRGARNGQGSFGRGWNSVSGLCCRRRCALGSRQRSGMRSLSVSVAARRASLTGQERGLDPRRGLVGPVLARGRHRVLLFRRSLALRLRLEWGFEGAGL
jgi:hypothetical protein